MENVITFTRFWYLIKRTTHSIGIRANWINCLLYKVLLIYSICYVSWSATNKLYIFILIKIIVQFLECKIPERVLSGAISVCRRFSKLSHRCEAKMCGLSLLAIFTFWVFTLWHVTLVLYPKGKSSITPAPWTTKLISKQARLNATKSIVYIICTSFCTSIYSNIVTHK